MFVSHHTLKWTRTCRSHGRHPHAHTAHFLLNRHRHAGIDSTLYYVHASPDFMDGYADLVADAERVVPETEEP